MSTTIHAFYQSISGNEFLSDIFLIMIYSKPPLNPMQVKIRMSQNFKKVDLKKSNHFLQIFIFKIVTTTYNNFNKFGCHRTHLIQEVSAVEVNACLST